MNSRPTTLLLALITATAITCSASAQDAAAPQTQPPAPIERSAPAPDNGQQAPPQNQQYQRYPSQRYPNQQYNRAPQRPQPPAVTNSQPAPGLFLKSEAGAAVQTVSATPDRTELRVTRGRINLNVHHPAHKSFIQVDLPGGQTNILKDGLYTFNADTNTVRVLKGEAETSLAPNAKPIKIKEFHQLIFNSPNARSIEVGPRQAFADILPPSGTEGRPRGDGYYGEGFYGPYAYGYPYAYYPYPYFGVGLGFGFGGGFRGRFR